MKKNSLSGFLALRQPLGPARNFLSRNTTINASRIFRRAAGLLLLLCVGLTANAALRTWTGSAGTNWNNSGNWSPAVVPAAGDSVVIPSQPSNQPIIMAGTSARAASVQVAFGAKLEILQNAELEISGTTFYGLSVGGTVNNSGTLRVKKAGFHGIDLSGSMTNNGVIVLGEATATPYSFDEEGIRMTSTGSFTNNGTGSITILRPGNNGILLFTGSPQFTNYGQITVWDTGRNPVDASTADGIDTRAGSFVNETTGDIFLTATQASGFYCRVSGSATNKGQITIRNVGLTPTNEIREGISNSTNFNNTSTGVIDIDSTGNNGILNQGVFTNSGQIHIGALSASSIGNQGVANLGSFTNKSGATLTIANTVHNGILASGLAGQPFVNENGGTITIDNTGEDGVYALGLTYFDNNGILDIGVSGDIGGRGISNSTGFVNQGTGALNIQNTAGGGILNTREFSFLDPDFKNAGVLTIGAPGDAASTLPGIENRDSSKFENLYCGDITTYLNIVNVDSFINESFLSVLGTKAQANSGHFINLGAIQDPNNTFGNVSITNNDFIVYAASGECTMANALKKGAGSNVTIGATWYKLPNLTQAAGTYNQAANSFTVGNLAEGISTLYFLATDNAYGCTKLMSVKVNYDDVTPPVIQCPANQTVTATANCTNTVGAYTLLSKMDNCSTTILEQQSPAAGTVLSGHNDVKTVTLTANDGHGNTQNCQFTVTLKDVTKPVITCPANTTVAADANCSGVVGAYALASKMDNCTASGSITEQQSPAASTVLSGHNDVKTVTLTADDGHGNTQSCQFTVTLKDVAKPVITCPANTTVAADANCSGVVGAYALASKMDNCTASSSITEQQSPAANTVLSGHNDVKTVTLTAEDSHGNTQSCQFTVTLKDVTKPVVTCPANTTVAANSNCSGVIGAYALVSKMDNCTASGSITEQQSPAANTLLSGHNDVKTVTLTADDGHGNTQSCQLTVTLKDITKPVVTCPANTTVAANGNCSGVIGAYALASKMDNCTASGSITEQQSPAASTVLNGHNDVKTVTLTADDGHGNTQSCQFTVTLKDVAKPVFTFIPANITVQCNSVPAPGTATATDNCSGAAVVYNGQTIAAGACTDSYTITRKWTATDAVGNTKTATQLITVQDTQKPVFTSGPANVTVQCNNIPAPGSVTATDNCDTSVSIAYNGETRANGACPDTYVLTRKWTATDNCGNTQTYTQKITVQDTQAPVFTTVPANATLECSATLPMPGTPTATDNCDASVTVTYLGETTANATCDNAYQLLRTWQATDNCGNFSVTTQTITIQDTQAPTFTSVPANVTIQCSQPIPAIGQATASDACGGYVQIIFQGQTMIPGSCPSSSTITRTWRAQDLCGNAVTASQTITIQDTQAPAFNNAPANIAIPCGADLPVPPAVTATDNCDTYVPVTYLGQTSTGSVCPYTVTRRWTVSDDCGNAVTHTQIISVGLQSIGSDPVEARNGLQAGSPSVPKRLNLAPNPTADQVSVDLADFEGLELCLTIYNTLGTPVWKQELSPAHEPVITLSLTDLNLATGMYAVAVEASGFRVVKPLLLTR